MAQVASFQPPSRHLNPSWPPAPPPTPPQREHLAPDFSLFHAGDVGDDDCDGSDDYEDDARVCHVVGDGDASTRQL